MNSTLNENTVNSSVITAKHINYSYLKNDTPNSSTLNDIDISINNNEIFTIIGPNGCGKSTLLKVLSNLLPITSANKSSLEKKYLNNKNSQTSSSIIINNKYITDYTPKELARTISILPQSRNIPNISIERLVEHGRFPYLPLSRHLSENDMQIVDHAIDILGINKLRKKELPGLSGGERQRAYIAMTLAQDTPIIFMDEPTTYLDINYQFELLDIIKSLNEVHNKTIVMILHDICLALKYSTRIAVMNNGTISFIGTPDELINSNVLQDTFHIKCTPVILNNTREYIISR